MNWVRGIAAAVGLLLAGVAAGEDKRLENKLPEPALKALEKAEAFELYSLNGDTDDRDGWHGAKVLGKLIVKKAADRKAIISAVKKGVDDGADGARCFIPRHGLRVTHDGKTYDLLICFECRWVYVYSDTSDKPLVLMTTETPQKLFNKLLTDAKIPLAKPDKPAKSEK